MEKKRIYAWLGLAAFVLLLIALAAGMLTEGVYTHALAFVYILAAAFYLVYAGKKHTKMLNDKAEEAKNRMFEKGKKVDFEFGYGKSKRCFSVNEYNLLAVAGKNNVSSDITGIDSVTQAMDNPIGTPGLRDIVKPGEKVVIITSDVTRPMPSKKVLPVVLRELREAGVDNDSITVVFAIGSHRKQTEEEMRYLVGDEVYDSIKCVDSDPDDCINMGTTSRGTPVDVTRVVAEADKRIAMANIEYHYFAGYSGGAKPIMPGVSSRDAIRSNHSAMVHPNACAAIIKDNPVREDIEEAVNFCSIDFIVNVVLNEKKEIVKTVAGHYIKAHREGCLFLDKMYMSPVPRKADIVITTPGGYPKDINLYQAQKALDNAKHAVKDGGIIILSAACTEGMGEDVFIKWYAEAKEPQDLINRVNKKFELGGHKAAAIALVMEKAEVFLVSEFSEEKTAELFMTKYPDINAALQAAYKKLGNDAAVMVMPYGGSTLPMPERK